MSSVYFRIVIPSEVEEFRLRAELVQRTAKEVNFSSANEAAAADPCSGKSGSSPVTDDSSKKPTPSNMKSLNKSTEFIRISHFETAVGRGVCLNLEPDATMQKVLHAMLAVYKIQPAFWRTDNTGNMIEVTFTIPYNECYEQVLGTLHEWGIGERVGSTVSVMSCHTSRCYTDKMNETNTGAACEAYGAEEKKSAWHRFVNSARARLNVAQIVRDLHQDARITFDFVVLLIAAAVVASFGLIENSTIYLASSMLISPLMGPIIAAIFGTVIRQKTLYWIGMKNELIGIIGATLVGFVCGIIVSLTDERYGLGEGLTDEMLSRCELGSLLTSIFTAIASGAAAAVGILGGNIGSLVGVAISASLLPPAVNSGLLWAIACVYKIYGEAGEAGDNSHSRFKHIIHTNRYSDNEATELAILASISMCLTIANVICVYAMGIIVLKIKEIAPIVLRKHNQFWKHDIKVARNMNKNGGLDANERALMYKYGHIMPDNPYETCPASSVSERRHTPVRNKQSYTTVTDPEIHQHLSRAVNCTERHGDMSRSRKTRRSQYPAIPFGYASPSLQMPRGSAASPLLSTGGRRFTVTPAADVPLLDGSCN